MQTGWALLRPACSRVSAVTTDVAKKKDRYENANGLALSRIVLNGRYYVLEVARLKRRAGEKGLVEGARREKLRKRKNVSIDIERLLKRSLEMVRRG